MGGNGRCGIGRALDYNCVFDAPSSETRREVQRPPVAAIDMKEGRTKVVGVYHEDTIQVAGVFHRLKLGLGPKEIGTIWQVVFQMMSLNTGVFFQAISADPDEGGSLAIMGMRNDRNLLASRTFSRIGSAANGFDTTEGTLVIPIPGGFDVAADMGYLAAADPVPPNVMHGVAVYYQVRKAAPGEREALIMARR